MNNVEIFDEALALIEATPRQFRKLANGETLSYREYNARQPHVLVMLPGFVFDDTLFSLIAVLPEFRDHRIIAVNPRGWNGSSMNTPVASHEENSNEVVELLGLIGIEKAMVGGYSTGGGIAFYMAQKYPEIITAAFLFHSIPLNGMKVLNSSGEPMEVEELSTMATGMWPNEMSPDALFEKYKQFMSSNPDGLPKPTHGIFEHLVKAANMPGKKEAVMANMNFNVTPIKTHYTAPNDTLTTLKSNVVVIHGSKDSVIAAEQVELVTRLAIVEHWAPSGTLSFVDDGEGHLAFLDNPTSVAATYRRVFEENVLRFSESL